MSGTTKSSVPPMKTPIGVLSFPTLFVARSAVVGQEPRFSLNLLFSPEVQKTAEYRALDAAMRAAATEKWGANVPRGLRSPRRTAGDKDYAGYEPGWTYIAPWSKMKPRVLNNDMLDMVPEDVWAGQHARAFIKFFAYDTSGNKGVACRLDGVHITSQNQPRLDGRRDMAEVFNDGVGAEAGAPPAQRPNAYAHGGAPSRGTSAAHDEDPFS